MGSMPSVARTQRPLLVSVHMLQKADCAQPFLAWTNAFDSQQRVSGGVEVAHCLVVVSAFIWATVCEQTGSDFGTAWMWWPSYLHLVASLHVWRRRRLAALVAVMAAMDDAPSSVSPAIVWDAVHDAKSACEDEKWRASERTRLRLASGRALRSVGVSAKFARACEADAAHQHRHEVVH